MRHIKNELAERLNDANSYHILLPLVGACGVEGKVTKGGGKNLGLWSSIPLSDYGQITSPPVKLCYKMKWCGG